VIVQKVCRIFACLAIVATAAMPCRAYFTNGRWASTASGVVGPIGTPATLTWSIVPDGTAVPGYAASNLVAFLDGVFGAGTVSGNFEQRPWFSLLQGSFDRWTALGGVTFAYEPSDDGMSTQVSPGILNLRGDVRLGGTWIDGPGGTNAQAGFIPNADITIDTSDGVYFGDPSLAFRSVRNTLMHEIGHSFGLAHTNSNNAQFLLEPFSTNAYDGPQFDDIRGLHALYGDVNEKAGGNDAPETATNLGILAAGSVTTRGANAATGTFVDASESDFVSVVGGDVDYFSFVVDEPLLLDVQLAPHGPTYNERMGTAGPYTAVSTNLANDLHLTVYALGAETTPLVTLNDSPIGGSEMLTGLPLAAGAYAVAVSGLGDAVQLYQLALHVREAVAGDFDRDGDVDGGDLLAWQRGVGVDFNETDLVDWQTAFAAPQVISTGVGVPEPQTTALAAAGTAVIMAIHCRPGRRRAAA
jgi:hypothetical protein